MIIVQKNYGDGVWHVWSSYDSVAEACDAVRAYCMAPGVSFRVLDHEGMQRLLWEAPFGIADQLRALDEAPLAPNEVEIPVQHVEPGLALARAFRDAADVLRPKVGDTMHVKIVGPSRVRVSVDRA